MEATLGAERETGIKSVLGVVCVRINVLVDKKTVSDWGPCYRV